MATRAERTSPHNKDVHLLYDQYKREQLTLAPEFQRLSIWPRAAKAYLIDTILTDQPIPFLFFRQTVDPQTYRSRYSVVDGQQRLRAIFDFIDNKFSLGRGDEVDERWRGCRFSTLPGEQKAQLLSYDLSVIELRDYSDEEIRDIFIRMNKYVVRLNRTELRHATPSAFKDFLKRLRANPMWDMIGLFTQAQTRSQTDLQFLGELTMLLFEGIQDKKERLDWYYNEFEDSFPPADDIERRLNLYVEWFNSALPNTGAKTIWKRLPNFYSLMGALDSISDQGEKISLVPIAAGGDGLREFEARLLGHDDDDRVAQQYEAASARQTDNLRPRQTRGEILLTLFRALVPSDE